MRPGAYRRASRNALKRIGVAGRQGQPARPVGLGGVKRRPGLSRRFGHDLIAIGVGFVDPALAIAGGTRDVAVGVDDLERRMDVLKRDAADRDAESIGSQPLRQQLPRRPFPPRACLVVSRSSNGRRPTTSRTADSASGLERGFSIRDVEDESADRVRIGRVDRKLKRRRHLDVPAVAGQQERRAVAVVQGRPAMGRLPPQRFASGTRRSRESRSPGSGPGRAAKVVTRSIGYGQRRCKPGPSKPRYRPNR